jgi:hypothetical protein
LEEGRSPCVAYSQTSEIERVREGERGSERERKGRGGEGRGGEGRGGKPGDFLVS